MKMKMNKLFQKKTKEELEAIKLEKVQGKLLREQVVIHKKYEQFEKKNFKTYNKLCPNPVKDKEVLPSYWMKFNKLEKVRYIEQNIVEGVAKDLWGVKTE